MTGLEIAIGVGVVGGLFYIYKLATGVKNTNKSTNEPLSEWLNIYERTSQFQKPAMACALFQQATTVGVKIGALSPHDKVALMSEAKRGDYTAMLDVLLTNTRYISDPRTSDAYASITLLAMMLDEDPDVAYQRLDQCLG